MTVCRFFTFFVIFCVAAGEKTREEITQKCSADIGVSEEEIRKVFIEGLREENFDRYKCFFKCMLQELEMIDSDGNVNAKKIKELGLDFSICFSNSTSGDVCVKATGIFHCLNAAHDVEPVGMPSYNVSAKCYDELGSERDAFFEFLSTEYIGDTDNQKFKCFYKCTYLEWEWMTEDGNFINKDKIYENLRVETESDKSAFDHCFQVTGKDTCEKAFNFRKCYNPKNRS